MKQLHTIAALWGSRAVTLLCGVWMLRQAAQLLPPQAYSAYLLLQTSAGWFALAEFGSTAALQNRFARAYALKESVDPVQRLARWTALTLSALVLALLLLTAGPLGHWLLEPFELSEAPEPAVWIVAATAAATAILTVGQRFFLATGRGLVAAVPTAAAACASVAAMQLLRPTTLAGVCACALVPAAVSALVVFVAATDSRERPTTPRAQPLFTSSFAREAFGYAAVGTAAAATLYTDAFLSARLLPAAEYAAMALIQRLMEYSNVAYTLALHVLWPTATALHAQGDSAKLRQQIGAHVRAAAVVLVLGATALSLFRVPVAERLAPGQPTVIEPLYVWLCAAALFARMRANTYAVVLYSIAQPKVLLQGLLVQAALGGALQWALIPWLRAPAVPLAALVANVLTVSWYWPRATASKLRGPSNKEAFHEP